MDASRQSDDVLSRSWNAGRDTARRVTGTLKRLGSAGSLLRKPIRAKPGDAPGLTVEQLAQLPPGEVPTTIRCLDFGPGRLDEHEDPDLETLLDEPRPDGVAVRWIDVQGLGDRQRLATLADGLHIHPLVLEDVLNLQHRPKLEPTPPGMTGDDGEGPRALPRFLVLRMAHARDERLISEQVSLLAGPGLVVSFQQVRGDPWDPIRKRLSNAQSLLRQHDGDFLVYALIDAIVDFYFPALERYANLLDAIEAEVFNGRGTDVLESLHTIRHELMALRSDLTPIRDVVAALRRGDAGPVDEDTRLYLGDALDHAVQALELMETYRDRAAGLADTYMSVVSNRMNEVMKVLTIVGSIFIPLGFLAGVYGMNFERLPGSGWRWGFWAFLGSCVAVAGGMLVWFRRKRWV